MYLYMSIKSGIESERTPITAFVSVHVSFFRLVFELGVGLVFKAAVALTPAVPCHQTLASWALTGV